MGNFCYSVPNDKIFIVEKCGRFDRQANPGCLCLIVPCVCKVAGNLSTRINQLDTQVETKTLDNVFVDVSVSVQYMIQTDKVKKAFYSLSNPVEQIQSYVFDVVRSTVPQLNLDQVFESKDDIAQAVKSQLKQIMDDYGFLIVKTLVTDVSPDQKVKNSMNEINASKRTRIAVQEKAEADKLFTVKKAEAEAEAKYLQGAGIAKQRQAIAAGLKDSISGMTASLNSTDVKEVLDLVLLTQYFDTLKEIGATSGKQTIFVPHNPGSLSILADELKRGVMPEIKI